MPGKGVGTTTEAIPLRKLLRSFRGRAPYLDGCLVSVHASWHCFAVVTPQTPFACKARGMMLSMWEQCIIPPPFADVWCRVAVSLLLHTHHSCLRFPCLLPIS